jgi:hypothetical protein
MRMHAGMKDNELSNIYILLYEGFKESEEMALWIIRSFVALARSSGRVGLGQAHTTVRPLTIMTINHPGKLHRLR